MNKLDPEKRATILRMLCEGDSIRAIASVTGVSKNTITKLLIDAGRACMAFYDQRVRNVRASRIQCDETWSFCSAKAEGVPTTKVAPAGAGDVWTWTALDADSKLIVSYLVADRSCEAAMDLVDDLCGRLANRVKLTTDGHRAYLAAAVDDVFCADVDYAPLVKLYGSENGKSAEVHYIPADCTVSRKRRVEGSPDEANVTASHAERSNRTMRMRMSRFSRLTNTFSKKIENYTCAVALHVVNYNFVRRHKTLRTSPAMAAGISDRLWSVADIVMLVEMAEAANPTKRGPYKKILS